LKYRRQLKITWNVDVAGNGFLVHFYAPTGDFLQVLWNKEQEARCLLQKMREGNLALVCDATSGCLLKPFFKADAGRHQEIDLTVAARFFSAGDQTGNSET
jgi:hypothetical protein